MNSAQRTTGPHVAAIYARKSTDQNVPDEEKSVTRQVEHARAYAARKGWTVAEEHVYQDDGISGAEFIKRPGYLALMNALRPRAPFQVLIVMDQSRLGRSLDEIPYALKRITDAGAAVYCYLTDTEIKRGTAVDRFLVNAIAFVDDMHREQSRQRTRDAMRRKAKQGHVAGGAVYAYRNIRRNGHVERDILQEEAEVVRRLFREIAAGRGYLKIAQRLNSEGIPGPWGRLWAGSSIRAMIFRELYRGQLVYGKTRWEDRASTRLKVDAPAQEWITVEAPGLRIVPEELWQAAHQRLAAGRAVYLRRTGGRVGGRPTSLAEPRYLLSGLLRCGHCGGSLNASRHTGRKGEHLFYYVCTLQRTRGIPCPGALRIRMEKVDEAILDAVRDRLLRPERVAVAVKRAAARLAAAAPDGRRRQAKLRRDLRQVEQELARYAEAIARVSNLPAILEAMAARERRRAALQAELGESEALEQTSAGLDEVAVTAGLRKRCAEWRALLGENPPRAQPVLRRLLPERLSLERTPNGIRVTGMAAFGPLMAGIALCQAMVPPGGTDSEWRTMFAFSLDAVAVIS